jgi:DNA polymerase-3 subunit epsilon
MAVLPFAFSDPQGGPLNNDQLDFAFVADLPTAPIPSKKRASRSNLVAPAAAVSPVAFPPNAGDAESIANTLDAHPDYRVLRRLQPRLQWPQAVDGQGVCRVIVLDTETTGLDHSREKIIELALLRVDVDMATGLPVGVVQVYDGLEDPGIPIPKEIEGITGINNDMVRGQRLDEDRIAALLDGVDLVIAHNAGFDRPFAEARIPRFQQLAWACSFADIDWKDHGRNSAKLENLALEMGCFYDAHRAEMDCHALLAVLAVPLPRLAHTGLAHLISQGSKPSYRLQATNAPFDAKDKLKTRGYRWNADQKVWHTRIGDADALRAECEWLKENVYHQRNAVVQIEKLDAGVRYSSRSGEVVHQQL